MLFPGASDAQFADGYAQVVTFGLLLAREQGISLDRGVGPAAKKLSGSNSLIGHALRALTDSVVQEAVLPTSVGTLGRVLSVVDWPTVSKGNPEAWLYFYEEFLAEYDNALRKQTGSYYTPVEVVKPMTRMVDEALHDRFGFTDGLANPSVTLVDPAMGTGTFLLEFLARSPPLSPRIKARARSPGQLPPHFRGSSALRSSSAPSRSRNCGSSPRPPSGRSVRFPWTGCRHS